MISKHTVTLFLLLTSLASCSYLNPVSRKDTIKNQTPFSLDSIINRGRLIAVSDNESINYFISKGEPTGFHYELLKSFANHLGVDLEIVAENNLYNAFEIVNSGEADLMVMDFSKYIGKTDFVNEFYFPEIEISNPAIFPQSVIWGVRKQDSFELLNKLNGWINDSRNRSSYVLLYFKYFKYSPFGIVVRNHFFPLSYTKLSAFDNLIKRYSAVVDWDWRLLASLICQESHFDPDVQSVAGAYGLMQIMPATGKRYGIDITSSPENNIKAGVRYLKKLNSIFEAKVPDSEERIDFILASYNAGPGHVLDAMRLAGKNGMDPAKWDENVAVCLLKKSQPKYFKDSVVKNGYFRGTETIAFVNEVINRYEHYKNLIPSEK